TEDTPRGGAPQRRDGQPRLLPGGIGVGRALGLDLGSYSVKALFLDTAARGARQLSFFEVRRAEGERTETLKAALEELFAEQPALNEQLVVAFPGSTLALHALTLPFTDPKRIEATLPFELESQLPFELTDAVYDYQRSRVLEGKSALLAGV